MDIRKLQRAIVDGLEDVKGQDIVVFNTEHLSPLFERVIIASGTSNRQTKALASSVRDKVRGMGGKVLSTEGADNGEWIIVDCGAAVAHILQPALRHYYHLEELWGGKPVNVKLVPVTRGLVKASEPESEDEDEDEDSAGDQMVAAVQATVEAKKARAAKPAVAVKTTSSKSAKKAVKAAKKSTKTVTAAPARKAAKTAAKKVAKTTPRSAVGTAAKKTPARKAAAKKAVVRTIVVKSPARKVVAKKAPARRPATKTVARAAAPARKVAAKKTTRRG